VDVEVSENDSSSAEAKDEKNKKKEGLKMPNFKGGKK